MNEWLKFALALFACLLLLIFVFALAIYCRDRAENDTILPTLAQST